MPLSGAEWFWAQLLQWPGLQVLWFKPRPRDEVASLDIKTDRNFLNFVFRCDSAVPERDRILCEHSLNLSRLFYDIIQNFFTSHPSQELIAAVSRFVGSEIVLSSPHLCKTIYFTSVFYEKSVKRTHNLKYIRRVQFHLLRRQLLNVCFIALGTHFSCFLFFVWN